MKSIGLVTPFLVAGAVARINKLNARDIISVGPDGRCCPAPVTVQVQPAYYSQVFKYPTAIDPFQVGETVTITACPFTVITTRLLTTTVSGTLPAGCSASPVTTSASTATSSSSGGIGPGLGSTSSSSMSLASASSASSASASVSISTSVAPPATTAVTSGSVLSQFYLAYTTPAAAIVPRADIIEKRQILPGQTALPATLIDLISGPVPTANVVLPAGCNGATLFTLNAGVLIRAGTNDAIAKQNGASQAVFGSLVNETPNEINTTFALTAGFLSWTASDGSGTANFFACANGVFAGFPTFAVDGCIQVQLRTFGLDECNAAQQSTSTSSTTSTVSASSGQVATSSSSSVSNVVLTSSSSSSSLSDVTTAATFSTVPPFANTTTSSVSSSSTTDGDTSSTSTSDDVSSSPSSSSTDVSSSSSSISTNNDVGPTLFSTTSSSSSSSVDIAASSSSSVSVIDESSSSSSSASTSENASTLSSTSAPSASSSSSEIVSSLSTASSLLSTTASLSTTTTSTFTSASASATCVLNLPGVCLALRGLPSLQVSATAIACQQSILQVLNVNQLPSSLNCLLLGTLGLRNGNDILTCIANGGLFCPFAGPSSSLTSSSATVSLSSLSTSLATSAVSVSSITVSSSSVSAPSSLTTSSAAPNCVLTITPQCAALAGQTGLGVQANAITCALSLQTALNVGVLPASLSCIVQAAAGIGGADGDALLLCIVNSGVLCASTATSTGASSITSSGSIIPTCVVNLPAICLNLAGQTGVGLIAPAAACELAIEQVLNINVLPASLSCLVNGVLGLGNGDDILACIVNSGLLCASTATSTGASSITTSGSIIPTCVVNLPAVCLDLSGQTGLGLLVPAASCQVAIQQVLNVNVLPASLSCLVNGVLGLGDGDDILACIINSGLLCPITPSGTGSSTTATSSGLVVPSCVVNLPAICLDLSGQTGVGLILPAGQCEVAVLQVLQLGVLPASLQCLANGVVGLGNGDDILACIVNSGLLCAATPTASNSASATPTGSILPILCVNLPATCQSLAGGSGLGLTVNAVACAADLVFSLGVTELPAELDCLLPTNIGLFTQGDDLLACIAASDLICPVPSGSTTAVSATATPTGILGCATELPAACTDLINDNGLSLITGLTTCLAALTTVVDPVYFSAAQSCLDFVPTVLTTGASVVTCLVNDVLCVDGQPPVMTPSSSTTGIISLPTTIIDPSCLVDLPQTCLDLAATDGLNLLPEVPVCLTSLTLTALDAPGLVRAGSCLSLSAIDIFTDGQSLVDCLVSSIQCTGGGTVPTPTTTAGPTATSTGIITLPSVTLPAILDCLAVLPVSCSSLATLNGLTLIASTTNCLLGLQGTSTLNPTRVLAATVCINSLNPFANPQGNALVTCLNNAVLCT